MEPVGIVALITAAIPLITMLTKKIFKTDKIETTETRKGIHALIPIVIGILTSGLYAYNHGADWMTALAVGLGSGGTAASARNIGKNVIDATKDGPKEG